MNADSFILKNLKGKYSPQDAEQILAAIPASQKELVQHLLNNSLMGVACKVRGEIIKKSLKKYVPHDICPKRHFYLSLPVLRVALHIHRISGVHPAVGKYGIAFVVVFSGAWMAVNPVHGIPHFLWDGIAYTIHGMGAAPIVESVLRKLEKRKTP